MLKYVRKCLSWNVYLIFFIGIVVITTDSTGETQISIPFHSFVDSLSFFFTGKTQVSFNIRLVLTYPSTNQRLALYWYEAREFSWFQPLSSWKEIADQIFNKVAIKPV